MKFAHAGNTYVLKIEKGEELMNSLTSFCAAHGIENATFTGIGAAQDVSCGYYALEEKKYHFTTYPEIVEVVSLQGNVTLKEGKPALHVHAVFTDRSNTAFGGHVEKMSAGIVLEIVLQALPMRISRELDDEIGLFLMNCENEF